MIQAFVTGGTGFVGANLVAGLNDRGIIPRALMRRDSSLLALKGLEYEPVYGDVLDEPGSLVEVMQGCDWVFHVAAVSDYWRINSDRIYRVNVDGTRNMVQAALKAGVGRFVFTSSLAAMGLPEEGGELDESCTFNIDPRRLPYGHSKQLAEVEVTRAIGAGLKAVIVNPTICMGPRDVKMNSGSIVVEAARGLARVVLPGGNNFVAVDDVVDGHISAAEKGRIGERYILGGVNMTNAEALGIVCEMVGRPVPWFRLQRWMLDPMAYTVSGIRLFFGNRIPFEANQVRMLKEKVYANPEKARRELGLPFTPFLAAVQQTYDWYKENGYINK